MRNPRRLFRSRRNEADIVVVTEANGRNMILGEPDLPNLQGYSEETVTVVESLSNYPKTLSSPGFYGGYTPFSDSY